MMAYFQFNRGFDIIALFSIPFIFLFLLPGITEENVLKIFSGITLYLAFVTQILFRKVSIYSESIAISYPASLFRNNRIYTFDDISNATIVAGSLALSKPTFIFKFRDCSSLAIRLNSIGKSEELRTFLIEAGVRVVDDRYA